MKWELNQLTREMNGSTDYTILICKYERDPIIIGWYNPPRRIFLELFGNSSVLGINFNTNLRQSKSHHLL